MSPIRNKSTFSARLLAWHKRHGRHDLPWQRTRDVYRIWVAEIMLQQTQVAAVIPYYRRFLERFPDIAALAGAPQDEVLRLWSGLGYYSRARNLQRAAQLVQQRHGGVFPRALENIEALPGIGRSTAAAVAAFACGTRAAILDGNVKRVLAQSCQALALGRVRDFPAPRPSRPVPRRTIHMLLLVRAGELLLEKRPSAGIWGGLWSLPELGDAAGVRTHCRANYGCSIAAPQALAPLVHGFTHFKLNIQPLLCRVEKFTPAARESGQIWLSLEEAHGAAIPVPVRKPIERLPATSD